MTSSPFRSRRRPAAALAALTLLLTLAGCAGAVLDPAGDVARQQRDIIAISTGVMLLIIVPVMVLICVFAWRYRKGSGATYDPRFDHSTALELVIWSAPLLIIIALGGLTWASTHLLDPFRPLDRIAPGKPVPANLAPMRVQVVAMDWKWLFIYPEQGIATVNELALPVNRQVKFEITSTNMMNTFYAPTLAGMIYAMPGMQSQLHAVLNRPGVYSGYSANYSGAGFSRMTFRLLGQDDAAFNQWVARVKASPQALGTPQYMRLLRPSEREPVTYYASVRPDLFRRVVEQCAEPGRPCMSAVMARDMARGGGHPHDVRAGSGMPMGRAGQPAPGDQTTGAVFKGDEMKETGEGRFSPGAKTDAPGAAKPGAPDNRHMSFLPSLPGDPTVGRA